LIAKLYLVRHGQDSGSGDEDADPGLNDLGHGQAAAMAAAMAPLGPLPIMVSPLRRTRETAQPLEAAWGVSGVVEPAVREIPSPGEDLSNRREWLTAIMSGTWAQVDALLHPWRQGVIDTLLALRQDSVIVSHFVAINVAVGAAQGDDRVRIFRPNNCSITVLESNGENLRLIELGEASETKVG
jgi:broad specificity phosphatase PhoE